MLGYYAIHNSSKRVSLRQKVGMSKVAYHLSPNAETQGRPKNFSRNAMKLCLACAQCSTRRLFTYVVGLALILIVNSFDTRPTAPEFRVFYTEKSFRTNPPQSPCVSSSCNMGFGLDETVNFHVMRPTAPGFRIFRGKCALYQTPQIRCVFSNKMRLGFNVIVNLYVMRPTAPKFIVFFQKMRFAISL